MAIALGSWRNIIAPISLIGLLSGLLTAAGQIIQHRTSKSDNITVINFVLFGLCSLLSLLLLLVNPVTWHSPLNITSLLSLSALGVILAFSFLSIANQTLKNAAYKYVTNPTSLVPFLYATIVFSGVIDCLCYDTVPQPHTIIGVCIIIIGVVIMSVRKLRS